MIDDQTKDTVLGIVWAALRSTRVLSQEALDGLLARARDALDRADPIAPLALSPLHDQMLAAGLSTTQAAQVVLFAAREAAGLGVESDLPASVRKLPAAAKKQLAEELALGFVRELGAPDAGRDRFDLTPVIDLKSIGLRDPSTLAPVLVVIQGRELGRAWRIRRGTTRIGRHADNDMVVLDDGVSRAHAEVRSDGKRHVVHDLGSRNGIVVNGFVVAEHALEEGDRVQIGSNTVLKFTHHDAVEHEHQEQLRRLVAFDAVTGALTRLHFVDRLRAECAFFGRHGGRAALLGVVVDDLGRSGEAHGQRGVDAILKELGALVRASTRVEDVIGRGDEDELLVLLRGTAGDTADVVARRILAKVAASSQDADAKRPAFTASVVIVGLKTGARDTPVELLDALARGMARARELGPSALVADPEF